MLYRVHFEEWLAIFKSIGLSLFLAVFILMLLRTFFTPRKKLDQESGLPFEKETSKDAHENRK